MGIGEVFDLLPHLRDLERLNIAQLHVVPLDAPRSEVRSTLLPVSAIRFTHDTVDGRAIFLHDEAGQSKPLDDRHSIYQTLDQLWRGCVKPEDLPALEVVLCDGKLWSLSNRRLADLKMLQMLQQQQTVWVACVLRPPSHPKFRWAKTTDTDGLSIRLSCIGDNIPFHMGAPAFNQAAQATNGLKRLVRKHPEVDSSFLRKVKLAVSKRRTGQDTLTLRSHLVAPTTGLESSGCTEPDPWLGKRQRLMPKAAAAPKKRPRSSGSAKPLPTAVVESPVVSLEDATAGSSDVQPTAHDPYMGGGAISEASDDEGACRPIDHDPDDSVGGAIFEASGDQGAFCPNGYEVCEVSKVSEDAMSEVSEASDAAMSEVSAASDDQGTSRPICDGPYDVVGATPPSPEVDQGSLVPDLLSALICFRGDLLSR
jgi:hypothetical protein